MNHGIERILTDLVVSSGYLVGWAAPEGAAHVVCHGYPGSYPPQLVPERLVSAVQRRLELIRAGVNKAK